MTPMWNRSFNVLKTGPLVNCDFYGTPLRKMSFQVIDLWQVDLAPYHRNSFFLPTPNTESLNGRGTKVDESLSSTLAWKCLGIEFLHGNCWRKWVHFTPGSNAQIPLAATKHTTSFIPPATRPQTSGHHTHLHP